MNKLDMTKAFAKLEGVEFEYHRTTQKLCGFYSKYNPFDLSLNCKARDDYQVNIEHCTQLDCGADGSGSYDLPYVWVSIKDPKGAHSKTPLNDNSSEVICFAVIECILKSKGLYLANN